MTVARPLAWASGSASAALLATPSTPTRLSSPAWAPTLRLFPGADDPTQLTLRANAAWTRTFGSTRLSVGPTFETTWEGNEPQWLRYGPAGELTTPLGNSNLVALSFAALMQDHLQQTYRSGYRVTGSAGLTHAFSPGLSAEIRIGADIERTQRAHLDYRETSARLQLSTELSGGLMLSGFAGLALRDYEGNYPLLFEPRSDERLTLGVTGAHRDFTIQGFMPTLTYQYTRQLSNVSFFDYDSHDISLGLTRNF
jgi:outer membrane protein